MRIEVRDMSEFKDGETNKRATKQKFYFLRTLYIG